MLNKYCSAPCGAGKTKALVDRGCELIAEGHSVLILQPTRELIDRTVERELLTRPAPPQYRVFHQNTVDNEPVAKALADYVQGGSDIPRIVFATHQVLPYVKHFENRSEWHLLVDEDLQVVRYESLQIPKTHHLITDHLEVAPVNAVYGLVSDKDGFLVQIARNQDRDEVFERFAESCRIIANRNWQTFVNLEQFDRLRRGEGRVLAFHSLLKPEILAGFVEVFIAGANFEDSAIYQLWSIEGVEFERDPVFAKGLRYVEHPNGELITIYYVTERQWSKKHKESVCGEEKVTVQERIIQAARELFSDTKFLWHANKSVTNNPFGPLAERLPNKPHGLNSFCDIDNIVFLSSLNPAPDHFRFLESRGLNGRQVRQCTYHFTAYQTVLRTSIRNPNNLQPKRILVPDRDCAEYLQGVFPNSKVEKIDIGLTEEPTKRRGRPKKHNSNRERLAQQRAKARQRKAQIFMEQLRLNSQYTLGRDSWNECEAENEQSLRAENGIVYNSNFGSYAHSFSLITSKFTSTPFLYVSCKTDEDLAEFLRSCHELPSNSKESRYLFSPAIFDPIRSTESSRGNENIAYLRHVVLDFENGQLKPEEIPNLFPATRMIVTNTFNHSPANPRFRVILLTSENMTCKVYGVVQGCIAEKLEDAGFSVERPGANAWKLSNMAPSGLDWSKSHPHSIFYLPCQAQNPSDSFFNVYFEPPRQTLRPSLWLENTIIPLQPELESPPLDNQNRIIDGSLVERATEIWRGSRANPSTGNEQFFNFALSLRRSGMDLNQIGAKLREEAQYGRTPSERLAQIESIIKSLRKSFARAS